MLRMAVLILGIVLVALGLWFCAGHRTGPGMPLLLWGVLLTGGILFERWRYGRVSSLPPPEPGWQRTGERFVDPESGKTLDVFYDPATGERRYVESRE